MNKITILGFIHVFLLLNLMACSTPQKSIPGATDVVAEFPVMAVGDSWTVKHYYADYGEATFTYKVTSVDSDRSFDIKIENNRDKNRGFRHFDSSSVGVRMIIGGLDDPEALQFPLFVGKAWETEVQGRSIGGDLFTYQINYVVEEFSNIETQAGNFEAFRIKGITRNLGRSWIGRSDYWYAPAAKAIVKSRHRHIRGVKLLSIDLVE